MGRRGKVGSTLVSSLAGVVLALTILPAEAAWHGYVSREVGFSFIAPGDMKAEKATYNSGIAGERDATVFQSVEDNIRYKVTVVDFTARANEGDALLKEASTAAQERTKVLADTEARVDSSYGRKMTVDLPNNGGRSMSGIYFKDGRLIHLEATVLPANGDYETPDMGRFIDSVAFYEGRAEADATELKLQK
jgi:hypothetical protein